MAFINRDLVPWSTAAGSQSTFDKFRIILERDAGIIFSFALVVNIFTYFIFISQHLLHNHGLRLPWIADGEQVYLGRWFNDILLAILYHADMPVLLPVVSGIISALTSTYLIYLLRLRITLVPQLLIAAILGTYPSFLSYYFYTWITPLFMIGSLFAILSLHLCERLRTADVAWGAFLFMLMMASYQPSLSVYATIAAGCIIVDLLRTPEVPLIEVLKTAAARIAAAAIGGVAYLISLKVFEIKQSHATTPLELSQLPGRFVQVVGASYRQFLITQPEFFLPIRILLLVFVIVAVVGSLYAVRKSAVRLLLVACIWIALPVATKIMFLVSADANFYQYRYNVAFGFLYVFAIALALHIYYYVPLRRLLMVLSAFVLLRFVEADLVRQEVLFRGQNHDLALANRILARMEALPDIDFTKTYDFVRIGKYSNFRIQLMKSLGHSYETFGDGHMDEGEVSDLWTAESVFQLLGNSIKFKRNGYDPDVAKKIAYARQNLLAGRKPWPSPDSVFIAGDTIYVYMR